MKRPARERRSVRARRDDPMPPGRTEELPEVVDAAYDVRSHEKLARIFATSRVSRTSQVVGRDRPTPGQPTAFFTSAMIAASSASFSDVRANAVGHMAPSSRLAASLKPSVAYLDLNFAPLWKKQTTLPSFA